MSHRIDRLHFYRRPAGLLGHIMRHHQDCDLDSPGVWTCDAALYEYALHDMDLPPGLYLVAPAVDAEGRVSWQVTDSPGNEPLVALMMREGWDAGDIIGTVHAMRQQVPGQSEHRDHNAPR
jgi:hypothetical protein